MDDFVPGHNHRIANENFISFPEKEIVWVAQKIQCLKCGHISGSHHALYMLELECKKCGFMTRYNILEDYGETP